MYIYLISKRLKESIKPERDRIKENLDIAKLSEASEPLMLMNQTPNDLNDNNNSLSGKPSGGGINPNNITLNKSNNNNNNNSNHSKGATTIDHV